jgi:hypothetical protein
MKMKDRKRNENYQKALRKQEGKKNEEKVTRVA